MIEKVFILHHTHVDLDYTCSRTEAYEIQTAMVGEVVDLVELSKSRPEPEQFRWTHEVSWPVLQYLRQEGASQQKMFEQIRQGQVELCAMYVNPTDLFDRRSFELTIDYACKLASKNNLPLTTAAFCDCPGIAWTIPDILAERGIKYFSTAPDVIMSMPLELERPFYWEGPDGGRVLTWFTDWRYYFYTEGLQYLKLHKDPVEGAELLLGYINQLENEGYRWRGLAIHAASDNELPKPQLMDFVAHFNKSQKKVETVMATNRQFFEFMEAEHGKEFAVHRGAWPDWWANGHCSTAYETACSRRTKTALRRCAALSQRLNLKLDERLFQQTFDNMVMYDEHTWGHKRTVSALWSVPVRLGQVSKSKYAIEALYQAGRLESKTIKQLENKGEVLAVNPFDNSRFGIVRLDIYDDWPVGDRPVLVDLSTQEKFVGQRSNCDTAGETGDYYGIEFAPGQIRQLKRSEQQARVKTRYNGLENDYLRIDYNRNTGDVRDVFDKVLGQNLCDSNANWGFAEIIRDRLKVGDRKAIYDISLGASNPEARRPRPPFIYESGHSGPLATKLIVGEVFNSLVTWGKLNGVRFIREIRLYHAINRADILLQLDKQVVTEYESLYLAFPFAAQSPVILIENAGAVYQAGTEQLPGSATDWHSLGEYVAVSDKSKTIVLVPHDTPVIQVGDINTGKWANRLDIKSGNIYSWLMNNMWSTNFPALQSGEVRFIWSMTAYPGTFDRKSTELFASSVRDGISYELTGFEPQYPCW